jgi:hypothetical protein
MTIPCLTFGYFLLTIIILSLTVYPILYTVLGPETGNIINSVIGTSVFLLFLYTLFGDRPKCRTVGEKVDY